MASPPTPRTLADLAGNSVAALGNAAWQFQVKPTTSGISDVTVDEDSDPTTIDLYAAFDDVETADDDLEFSIVQNSNSGLFSSTNINAQTGALVLGYAADASGLANLTVQATDEDGLTVQATFAVTVNEVNDPPVIVNFTAEQGATVWTVSGSVVDDEPTTGAESHSWRSV